jgi:vacuolar protein sorting-associated protein 53
MEGVSSTGPGTVPHYSDPIIKSLNNAHKVVAVMGMDVVEDLMDEIVQSQLLTYDLMGREGGSLYLLDKEAFERRWSGLRKLLYAADHRMGEICPEGWMLPHRLYIDFCDRTARHLKALLAEQAAQYRSVCYGAVGNVYGNGDAFLREALNTPAGLQETQDHVGAIVMSLKSCLAIEEEMTLRFEDDNMSLEAGSKAEEEVLARLAQGGIISSVFDNFMQPYVLLEKRTLESTVQGLMEQDGANQDDATDKERAHVIYDSAGRLFEAIRLSMKRCLALTCGAPFLLLSNEYAGSTQIYATALRSRCPTLTENAASAISGKGVKGAPPASTMTVAEEVLACRVINTAEYCAEVIPKLEGQIKQKIHMTLAKDVDMSSQSDIFFDVVAFAIDELVAGLLGRTDASLKAMKKMPWGTFAAVGDDSPYVGMLRTVLMECVPRIRHALSPLWFKNFCTHFSTEFLDQFLKTIMTQKKICPVGAEQLLLDTNSLKSLITQIHHIGMSVTDPKRQESPIPGPYTTVVGGRFKHIEVVLKLVCIEEEQFEEMFAIMWPEGEVSDMQAILELKHNPSMISSAASAVGDISGATTRGTKQAIGATSRGVTSALGAVGSTSRALGGSMSKGLSSLKNKTLRRQTMSGKEELEDGK